MNILAFQLNCSRASAIEYLSRADFDGVETDCDGDNVYVYLTKSENGIEVAEYVYKAVLDGSRLTGTVRRPEENNKPSAFKTFLLVVFGLIAIAALFGIVYLCVMLFARSPLLSLYIALPVFAGGVAVAVLAARIMSHKRTQIKKLRSFLAPITDARAR